MSKIDIEAIRRKLQSINSGAGDRKQFNRWKYTEVGTYKLRVLPWRDADPGMPFPQRTVFYGIGPKQGTMIVSPENDGNPCPIKEFRVKLYNDAKEAPTKEEGDAIREMAKKLNSKTATCVAVIDRAHEEDGPKMWNPNWTDAKQLLGLFLTDGVGDYTDLKHGFDLEITVTPSKKLNQRTKKPLLDARIDAARQTTPACKDEAKLAKWLENMPKIEDYFPTTSYADAEKNLKIWLDNGGEPQADAESDGTARGGKAKEQPKEASAEKPAAKAEGKKAAPSKPSGKKPILQQADDDLDEALADLE